MKSVLAFALLATAHSRFFISQVWIPATNEGPITDCSGPATIVAASSEDLIGTSVCDNLPVDVCSTVGEWSARVYCADTVPESTGQGLRTSTWIDSTTECDGPPSSVAYFGKTGCFPLLPSGLVDFNMTELANLPTYFKVACDDSGSCQDSQCTNCMTYPVITSECVGAGGAYSSITCGGSTQEWSITLEFSGSASLDAAEFETYLQQGLADWGIFGTVSVTENSDGSFSVTISNSNADESSVKRAAESAPGVSRATVTGVGSGASSLSLFF